MGCFRLPIGLRRCCVGCFAIVLFTGTSVHTQLIYQQRDATTPPNPESFMTAAATATCVDGSGNAITDKSVPDGGFVTRYTTLRADAAATVNGACDWYYSDGTFYRTEVRNLVGVKVYQYPPTLLASSQMIHPNTSTQSMDSRVSGTTSGGISAGHSELGTYRYTFTTFAYSTN